MLFLHDVSCQATFGYIEDVPFQSCYPALTLKVTVQCILIIGCEGGRREKVTLVFMHTGWTQALTRSRQANGKCLAGLKSTVDADVPQNFIRENKIRVDTLMIMNDIFQREFAPTLCMFALQTPPVCVCVCVCVCSSCVRKRACACFLLWVTAESSLIYCNVQKSAQSAFHKASKHSTFL